MDTRQSTLSGGLVRFIFEWRKMRTTNGTGSGTTIFFGPVWGIHTATRRQEMNVFRRLSRKIYGCTLCPGSKSVSEFHYRVNPPCSRARCQAMTFGVYKVVHRPQTVMSFERLPGNSARNAYEMANRMYPMFRRDFVFKNILRFVRTDSTYP